MSWEDMDSARQNAPSIFIRLKDGDSVEGVFRGDPHTFFFRFGDKSEHPDFVEGSTWRFRINLFVREGDEIKPKIFEGGARLRDMILDHKDLCGLDCWFKIMRKGSGMNDTRYMMIKTRDVETAELEEMSKIELLDLHRKKVDTSFDPDEF